MMDRGRKVKIVCTLGPASSSEARIEELIRAGMDVARLNFSHGDHQHHRRTVAMIRRISERIGKQVGILQDLQGPKIRIGNLPVPQMHLESGATIALVPEDNDDPQMLPVIYPHLLEDVSEGDHILLADGTIELIVVERRSDRLICRVLVGGTVQSHKGVNLPSSNLRVPSFTEKDREDLLCGLDAQVDFVALSFVRHEKDLDELKTLLAQERHPPMVIAKIEKPQAIERLEAIVNAVDGVMVARGDLGVEMPAAEVPLIQKRIIKTARRLGKPVITATQMLRSMVDSPRPTRAEISDVANAILDGTDAVMLSEETAVGHYPVEAVRVLDQVAHYTEPHIEAEALLQEGIPDGLPLRSAAVSRAACWLARDLGAAAIVAITSSGSTARLVAILRPPLPIIALTDIVHTQRQLTLSRGVIPWLVDTFKDAGDVLTVTGRWLKEAGLVEGGQRIILTAGIPPGVPGSTNLVKVMEIGSELN